MTRVVIADAHSRTRQAVGLAAGDDVEICGEATTAGAALAHVAALAPDVALVDVDLHGMSTLALVRDLCQRFAYTKVIVLSANDSPALAWLFRKAGADGYVLKSDVGRSLRTVLVELGQGRTYFADRTPIEAPARPDGSPSPPPSVLTEREDEVLRLLAEGRSNKEVAAMLNVSVNTIETHRARIMSKLDLHTINALVLYAIRSRLIDV